VRRRCCANWPTMTWWWRLRGWLTPTPSSSSDSICQRRHFDPPPEHCELRHDTLARQIRIELVAPSAWLSEMAVARCTKSSHTHPGIFPKQSPSGAATSLAAERVRPGLAMDRQEEEDVGPLVGISIGAPRGQLSHASRADPHHACSTYRPGAGTDKCCAHAGTAAHSHSRCRGLPFATCPPHSCS
jgi:hypothetical protein